MIVYAYLTDEKNSSSRIPHNIFVITIVRRLFTE